MSEPSPGAAATCAACGKPITYVGPYWDHVGEPKPRHIAMPENESPTPTPTETPGTVELDETGDLIHVAGGTVTLPLAAFAPGQAVTVTTTTTISITRTEEPPPVAAATRRYIGQR